MRKSIVESSKNVKKTRRLTRLEEAKELLRCQLITDQQAVSFTLSFLNVHKKNLFPLDKCV